MRTNTQEAVLSAHIVSIGKRTPRDAAQDAADLCRLANSLNRLNEIACNFGLTERQERGRYKPYPPPFCGLVGTNAMHSNSLFLGDRKNGERMWKRR